MALLEIEQDGWAPMIVGGCDVVALAKEVKDHALPGERVVPVTEAAMKEVIEVDFLPDLDN